MIFPFSLGVILIVMGLKRGELYAKEGVIFGAFTLACVLAYFMVPNYWICAVVPQVIVDVVLLFKLFGDNLSGR